MHSENSGQYVTKDYLPPPLITGDYTPIREVRAPRSHPEVFAMVASFCSTKKQKHPQSILIVSGFFSPIPRSSTAFTNMSRKNSAILTGTRTT